MTAQQFHSWPPLLDCAGSQLDLARPRIMGVLNVTPDSFSDGGLYTSPQAALQQAETMLDEGADIIDVGGESTRPEAETISRQQELDRVMPVIEAIKASRPNAIVSIDSSDPEVMREAAKAGAGMINDVRALSREGAMQAARDTGLPVCLMHMQGQPQDMQSAPSYSNVVAEVYEFLATRINSCREIGISDERLLVDPGFGFGKSLEHNLQLLNHLDAFAQFGLPILVGMSRKTMIGEILDKPVQERLFGSVAAAALAASKGASIIRCHDVAATADAVKLAAAVLNEGME